MGQKSPVAGVLAFFSCSHSFGLFAPPLQCDELEQDSLYKPHDLVTFYADFDVSTAGLTTWSSSVDEVDYLHFKDPDDPL